MSVPWAWVVFTFVVAYAGAERGGGSLRGALEALQRRQRGRFHVPQSLPDYDALYDVLPPQPYPDSDYGVDVEDINEDPAPKYLIKFLDAQRGPPESYEYRIIKKKNLHPEEEKLKGERKESPFRERSHHSDNDRLRDLFADRNDIAEEQEIEKKAESDAEYAMLLGQLWSKYKNIRQHAENVEVAPQGVVKLYKDKNIKKRVPDNWGPIAFKKKRSTDNNAEKIISGLDDYTAGMGMKPHFEDVAVDSSYLTPDGDKGDIREEYSIAFQPLEGDPIDDLSNDEGFSYDVMEKRFPVSKRSSGPFVLANNYQKKRFAEDKNNKYKVSRHFRNNAGTDPRIIKDLSKIFGESDNEILKGPVKRSSNDENSHEIKPPQLTIISHNSTHEQNSSRVHDDESHEQHGHNMHHPGMSEQEVEHVHPSDSEKNKPISIKKKSIDWSTYFGIDKRKKKSFSSNLSQDRLQKQYFDTFNKEVFSPVNSFRKHSQVKRNYVENKPNEAVEVQMNSARTNSEKNDAKDNDSQLDDIDKRLKNMESMIVDEALRYSNVGEELDSKEEQEVKEKLLSRLAAAYSLEKMRKAMKEFKQSLKIQKNEQKFTTQTETDEEKSKRIAIKKEKAELSDNDIPPIPQSKGDKQVDDFEGEQGAGHYLNGRIEDRYSEGYMGGSGRHRTPVISMVGGDGSCPVLERIIQRCRGVDLLAGDRGQLFLPLCSLHQICYLCGEAPQTTCDLVFLSEADTACEGDSSCQRAARSALMALRELHDTLADELDGECEASPCLPATLKLNISWQRALQR